MLDVFLESNRTEDPGERNRLMNSHAEMLEAKILNLTSRKVAVLRNEDSKAMLRKQIDEMNDQFTKRQTSLEYRKGRRRKNSRRKQRKLNDYNRLIIFQKILFLVIFFY